MSVILLVVSAEQVIAMETELSFHLLRWSFQPRPVGEAERGKLLFFLPIPYLLRK